MIRGEVTAGVIAGMGSALVVGLALEGIHLVTGGALSKEAIIATLLPPVPLEAAAVVGLAWGAIIGGLFGWLHRGVWLGKRSGLLRGGVYGLGWCLVAALLVGPLLRGMIPFSRGAVDLARDVLPAALLAHVLYGILLGVGFSVMTYHVLGRGEVESGQPRPRGHAA